MTVANASAEIDVSRLGELADVMLPAAHGMPSASDVKAIVAYLDQVLNWRSDLRVPLARAVGALEPATFSVDRQRLRRAHHHNGRVLLPQS